MKSLQIIYPKTDSIILNNVTYLQIGIERPHSAPISETIKEDNGQWVEQYSFNSVIGISTDGGITYKSYTITDKDILEFGDIYITNLRVRIDEPNNPYLIVDLAYETAE